MSKNQVNTQTAAPGAPETGVAVREDEAVFVTPHYRIRESEDAWEVGVVMPGVDRKGVDISLDEDILTVTGVRSNSVPETWRPVHVERAEGDFRLKLRLNVDVNEAAISAKLEDGVLTLRLPVAEAAKPRRIEVK